MSNEVQEYNNDDKEYRKFLQWYVIPDKERRENKIPQSIEEYSEKTGLELETISSYLDKPYWGEDVARASLDWGKTKTREIVQWAFNQVRENRNINDMKKFMEILEQLEAKQFSPSTMNNQQVNNFFSQLKPEQYEQIIDREKRTIEAGGEEEAA